MTDGTAALSRREPPGWVTVFTTQIELLHRLRRWLAPVLGAVAVLLFFGLFEDIPQELPRLFLSAPMLTFFSVFWAGVVWSDEGPSRRAYHWAMPVERRTHDLTRVAVGAVYLLGVFALFAALGLVFAAIDGNLDSALRLSAPFWANLFVAPLILYLMTSAFALLVDRPMLWLIGTLLAFMLALSLLDRPSLEPIHAALDSVISGEYGFAVAVAGGYAHQAQLISANPDPSELVDPTRWALAATLWTLLLTAACALAASVRPEHLAFLRRRRPRE